MDDVTTDIKGISKRVSKSSKLKIKHYQASANYSIYYILYIQKMSLNATYLSIYALRMLEVIAF